MSTEMNLNDKKDKKRKSGCINVLIIKAGYNGVKWTV